MLEYFVGVDTHQDSHSIAVLSGMGEVVDAFSIPTTPAGYAEAIARVSCRTIVAWGLEGTGSYGRCFAQELLRVGAIVHEVPGAISKRHRNRLRHRGKSDPQDAHAIAEAMLRERSSLPRLFEDDAQEALRILYERRDRKVRERTDKIEKIRAFGVRLGLTFAKDLTTKRSIDKARALIAEQKPLGYADLELVDDLRDLLVDTEHLGEAIRALEKRLGPFVHRLAPALLHLRGCSIVTAAGLIGHSGAMPSYRNADAYAAHAGAAPVSCSSGKHTSVRVNTGGNRQINRCLHTMANTQSRTIGHEGKVYYDRKRAEGKTHRAALRCLKRKLATVVFRTLCEPVPAVISGTLLALAA